MQSMMSGAVGSASVPFRRSGEPGRAGRTLIVAAVLVGLVWILAATVIPTQVFWLFLVLQVGPLLVAVAAFVASDVLGRARPPGFWVRDGVGFVVPPSRGFGALVVGEVMLMAHATNLGLRQWNWGGQDAVDLRAWSVLSVALLTAVLGFVAWLVVTALRGRPQILLTPAGIAQHGMWARRLIPWEALWRGQPVREVRGQVLTLAVDRPDLVVRAGPFHRSARRPRLVLDHLRVHPWFLNRTIRYYVDHPERTSAIGTPAEYERLLTALRVPAGV